MFYPGVWFDVVFGDPDSTKDLTVLSTVRVLPAIESARVWF